MSNDKRNPSTQHGPNLSEFIDFAKTAFRSTTGASPNISSAHQSLHGDLTKVPLTPSNVDRLIDSENFHAVNGLSNTPQDKLAFTFTPLRRYVAHTVARSIVVGQSGIDADNDYARQEKAYQKWKNIY